MLDINKRIKILREYLSLSQEHLGKSIGLSKSGISNIETGARNVTDKHVKLLVYKFNVSEEWLRNGIGEMFPESDTFSLDEYAKKNNLTNLELDILKAYMELDGDIRQKLMYHFKTIFNKYSELTFTKEVSPEENNPDLKFKDYLSEPETMEKNQTVLFFKR